MNQVEQDAFELGWRVAALLSLEEKIYFNGNHSDLKYVVTLRNESTAHTRPHPIPSTQPAGCDHA
jgi:hypothetical protein